MDQTDPGSWVVSRLLWRAPYRVDVMGLRIVGLRLSSGTNGIPRIRSLRLCQAVVEVRFVD